MAEEKTDSTADDTKDDTKDEVETTPVEDESPKEEPTEESPTEETDKNETEESDDESDSSTFTKRFTQFKGDSLEDYNKNLEEAYANSSTEATRLAAEVKELNKKVNTITGLVANDPELAEKLGTDYEQVAQQPLNPALAHTQQEWENKMKQEYDEFVGTHKELETDPTLAEKVNTRLAAIAKAIYAEEGRYVGMAEGLNLAWNTLGLSNKEEEVRMAAKDTAAMSKPAGTSKKSGSKSEFTEAQLKVAKQLGLTEEQLRKHVKNN